MIAWQQWFPYAKLWERWKKANSTKIYRFLISLWKGCGDGFDNISYRHQALITYFRDTKNGQTDWQFWNGWLQFPAIHWWFAVRRSSDEVQVWWMAALLSPDIFWGLNVASFLSFSVSTEHEDYVDATIAIWLLHCSLNNSLGEIADSDVSLIKVR